MPAGGGLAEAVRRVGDRWSFLVVESLLGGERRFGEIQEAVHGVASNVLSSRLKQLEAEGLLVSQPYSDRPVRFTYELTQTGAELAGALRMLASWGARTSGAGSADRHDSCGSELDVRWWCASCGEVVEPGHVEVVWV